MKPVLKKYLFCFASNPLSYIFSLAFVFFISLGFFIGRRFFSGGGTSDLRGFFTLFPLACVIFVPAASSLISRLRSDLPLKTFLYPLPTELSLFIFSCFSCALTILVPVFVGFFGSVQLSQVISGYIGIIFYLLSSVSFVIFILTLVENSGVAFALSFVFLAIVNYIHVVPLYFSSFPYFLGSVLRFVSFAWRFDSFAKGLLSLSDLLFFIWGAILFHCLSVFVQEKRRGNETVFFKKFSHSISIFLILFVILSQNLHLKIDLTKSRRYSVSSFSQNLLKRIEDPLSITYFLSPKLKSLYPQVRDVEDFIVSYADESKRVSFKVLNPAKGETEKNLSSLGIRAQPLQTESGSFSNVYSAIVIEYLGQTEIIPFVFDVPGLEYNLTRRIKKLFDEKENPVQLLVSSDEGVTFDLACRYLEADGFTVLRTVLPSQENEGKGVSFESFSDFPLVVFGSDSFTKEDTFSLERFILEGGRVFIASQPYSVSIMNDWSIVQKESEILFERMLFTFGLYFTSSPICDISNLRIAMTSEENENTITEYVNYPLWVSLFPQFFAPSGLSLFWPCGIEIDNDVASMENYIATPLLFTSDKAWNLSNEEGEFETNPFAILKTVPEEETGQFIVCAEVKKEGSENPSLIVLGEQYTFSDQILSYGSTSLSDTDSRSLDFLCCALLALSGEKGLLELRGKAVFNLSLYKLSGEDFEKIATLALFSSIAFPFFLLLIFWGVFFIRRRRFNR